jgi:hypothetical protein
MKKFLFILLLFSQSGIFAQRVKAPAWEQAATPYALNDIGEEYHITRSLRVNDSLESEVYDSRILADLSDLALWIKDSTMSDDILYLRAPGSFAIDLRYGIFVYHDDSGTTSVFQDPIKIIRVEHRRSSSIYYKYIWGDCHDEKNNYVPEMVVELVHRYGKTCIIATACGENPFINACSNQELSGLWDVFKPVRQIK